jgi:hypothetical protein
LLPNYCAETYTCTHRRCVSRGRVRDVVCSVGPHAQSKLSVDSLVTGNVQYWDSYVCPTFDGNVTYQTPCVRDDGNWTGGKALMWIGNVYKDVSSGGILAFIHMEFTDPRPEAEMCYFRFALGWSTDGGASFRWLGYLVEPALSYEHSMFGFKHVTLTFCRAWLCGTTLSLQLEYVAAWTVLQVLCADSAKITWCSHPK